MPETSIVVSESVDGVPVERLPIKFEIDQRLVITRPFFVGGATRVRHVVGRVDELSDQEVERLLHNVLEGFQHRHPNIEDVFEEHYRSSIQLMESHRESNRSRQLLIGAYFTMEYSVASAALFNPSIVPHPDQSGISDGELRFILSLRATGEGHLSSLVFRTGVIREGDVHIDLAGRIARRARVSLDRRYEKPLFHRKLLEMHVDEEACRLVMERLPDQFSYLDLEHAIETVHEAEPSVLQEESTESMHWLARENYELKLPAEADVAEIVIFPQSENESHGIEDLRLTPFVEDDGQITYYGTYSAYNGYHVLPQLLETRDFNTIHMHTLNGACVQNKGMALFPRRLDGHYVMCSRIDGENLYIMYSDLPHFWETAELLQTPRHPWEFVQIGNCGAPLETAEGWLLLTHGVGPMRSYSIGAMLLDLEDPLKVVGHLRHPLIVASEEEREGYVPNVVYTCGALIHKQSLYIPFAMSDRATGFARVELDALLERLTL